MSFKATTAFVKYIYGFEAEDDDATDERMETNDPGNNEEEAEDSFGDEAKNLDLNTIKEIILVAGIYEDTLKGT